MGNATSVELRDTAKVTLKAFPDSVDIL